MPDYLSLCLICKDENDYLPEWLDYHILAGVDRFYIYDNDSQVSLRESLSAYIEQGWVVVLDLPGREMQLAAYDHCLRAYGPRTRWIGFIDTDEFLVPKKTADLKLLLQEFEPYGGLAVSSLFFGSNGHQQRPAEGQIAAYLLRAHPTQRENGLVKSIVQPGQVERPASPHHFIFHPGSWCVNEQFLRVDHQIFPNYVEKIQLNHYFCRSEEEIEHKLRRGRGDSTAPWQRARFDTVNLRATYPDLYAARLAESLATPDPARPIGLLPRMAAAVRARKPAPREDPPNQAVNIRAEILSQLRDQHAMTVAGDQGDYAEGIRLGLKLLETNPSNISLLGDVAVYYIQTGDAASAWQALAQAWRLAPNSYFILSRMVYYFLRISNFEMAEKSCRLLLQIAPHDLTALGYLTEALIGQKRFEEAVKVGVPVVELAAEIGELPDRMGIFLVKALADILAEKKDFSTATHLWEAGVKCEPRSPIARREWARALWRTGAKPQALELLEKSLTLDAGDLETRQLLNTIRSAPAEKPRPRRH